jgi:hypothetical protein
VIVSPGENDALVLRERNTTRVPIRATREPDWNRNAPVKELPERFKAAMRAKGWLRS